MMRGSIARGPNRFPTRRVPRRRRVHPAAVKRRTGEVELHRVEERRLSIDAYSM